MKTGTLVVSKSKAVQVKSVTAKGKDVINQIAEGELSGPLAAIKQSDPTKLEGVAVEFETSASGQPKQVREAGQPWQPPLPVAPRVPKFTRTPHQAGGGPATAPPPRPAAQAQSRFQFRNPYNFIPALPRRPANGPLADHAPVAHGRLDPESFTGTLRVRMTAETPLLVLDSASARLDRNTKHRTFGVRTDAAGLPLLNPTGVKGMLRAAYEAVTNSRFGVFAGHADRLAFRQPAKDGLRWVPARIIERDGQMHAVLLEGTSDPQADGRPDGRMMYAAWLHMYRGNTVYDYNGLARHRNEVWAYVTPWNHGPFDFWNVVELRPSSQNVPTDRPADRRPPWRNAQPANQPGQWVRGYVCVTGRNINNKHDERVFFSVKPHPPEVKLEPRVIAGWSELIRDYAEANRADREADRKRPPALDVRCEYSRHIRNAADEERLTDGTLCYARLAPGRYDVEALYPVMIGRSLFECGPLECLDESLRPAADYRRLSPADRVFGWVAQRDHGTADQRDAYRGNLRVGAVRCVTPDGIESFPAPGLPLAILGRPKPQQAGFYVGDAEGRARSPGVKKEDGYRKTNRLRGRKVYPHQRPPFDGYWNPTANDGRVRHYLRQVKKEADPRDSQNRSVRGWIKPGTAFEFDLQFTNLSAVELGALLWLVSLPERHFHRYGFGKPLGFGSVRLELDTEHSAAGTGGQWAESYRTLADTPGRHLDRDGLIASFRHAVEQAYDGQFSNVPFVAAFLRAAEGYLDNVPTHYPRVCSHAPEWDNPSYDWFVNNERGPKLALPDLVRDAVLPVFDVPETAGDREKRG